MLETRTESLEGPLAHLSSRLRGGCVAVVLKTPRREGDAGDVQEVQGPLDRRAALRRPPGLERLVRPERDDDILSTTT